MSEYPSKPKAPLHPFQWPSWVAVGLIYLLAQLPFRAQYAFGHWLGRVARRLSRRRSNVVDVNLSLCFPELSSAERQTLVRRTFESLGVMFLELASLYFGRAEEIIRRGRVWGGRQLQDAIDEGNGVILIGIHQNCMEAAATVMHANGFAFSCVTRKQKNPVADFIVESQRKKRYGIRNVYELKDLVLAARHLRRFQTNLWLAADQDMGRRATVFVPFFGESASTVTTPARILAALKDRPPAIVLMSQYRDETEYRIHVKFTRVENLPMDDLPAACTQLNELMEAVIKEHPEQYYWVHRRFKTLPDGGVRNYQG